MTRFLFLKYHFIRVGTTLIITHSFCIKAKENLFSFALQICHFIFYVHKIHLYSKFAWRISFKLIHVLKFLSLHLNKESRVKERRIWTNIWERTIWNSCFDNIFFSFTKIPGFKLACSLWRFTCHKKIRLMSVDSANISRACSDFFFTARLSFQQLATTDSLFSIHFYR